MMRGDEPAASTAAEAAAEVVEGGPRPKVVGGAIAGLLGGAVEAMLDPFGIYTAIRDSAGRIVDFRVEYVNDAACAANRQSREEQLGRGLCELLPSHRATGLFDAYCRLVATGEPLAYEALTYADHYGGRWLERAFDIRAARVGDGFAASWRDITAQQRRERGLRLLAALGAALAGARDTPEVLRQSVGLVVPAIADAAAIYIGDTGAPPQRAAAAFATPRQVALDAELHAKAPFAWIDLPQADEVLRSGQPLLQAEIAPADDWGGRSVPRELRPTSLIGVPLIAHGQTLGALSLAVLGSGHTYDSTDLLLAQDLASCVAMALHAARLHAELDRLNRQVVEGAALLDVLLRNAPVGFAVQDADTRYLLVNERLAALNGRPAAEHVGLSVAEVVPSAAERNAAAVRHVVETGQSIEGLEFRGPVPGLNDAEGICEASYYPVLDPSGGVRAVGMVVVDVTSYRHAIESHAASLEREREARAAAEEARGLLDTLIATAPIGVAFFDRELRFQHINEQLAAINGLPVEAHLGRTPREVVPDLADTAEPLFQRVIATGEPLLDVEITGETAAAPGQNRIWRESFYPVRAADGRVLGVGAIVTEITEHRRMAAALRVSEEREQARADELAALLAAVPAVVWIAHDPAGQVITGNPAANDLLRMPSGSNLSKTAPAPDRPAHFRVLKDGAELAPDQLPVQQAAAGVEVHDFEEELVFDDGTRRTLLGNATPLRDSAGRPRGAVAAFLDITERKAAERDLARLLTETEATASRLARLQALTAGLSEALTIEQVADVIVEQGLAPLGARGGLVTLLDSTGKAFTNLRAVGYPPETTEAYRTFPADADLPIADAVRKRAPLFFESAEARYARYPRLRDVPALAEDRALAALPLLVRGQPIGGLGFAFDRERSFSAEERAFMQALAQQCAQALERARLYADEQRARAQAEAAVRMRDVFFSVAAHELRTPLTALLGQAQLLQRRLGQAAGVEERERRSVGVIAGQAARLNKMIVALLDIARLESGHLALDRGRVDVGSLIARVVEEIEPSLQLHSLVWDLPDEPLVVSGDALRLEQVFQNLIGNAVKYSPAGGVVMIRARRDGGAARVEVVDQGIGIPAGALPHLFQRFYRATNVDARQISGLGIGLYVVREIVQLHGGDVRAASVEGEGSTFTVALPLEASHGAEQPAAGS